MNRLRNSAIFAEDGDLLVTIAFAKETDCATLSMAANCLSNAANAVSRLACSFLSSPRRRRTDAISILIAAASPMSTAAAGISAEVASTRLEGSAGGMDFKIGRGKIPAGAQQRFAALLRDRIDHQIEQVEQASSPIAFPIKRKRFQNALSMILR